MPNSKWLGEEAGQAGSAVPLLEPHVNSICGKHTRLAAIGRIAASGAAGLTATKQLFAVHYMACRKAVIGEWHWHEQEPYVC